MSILDTISVTSIWWHEECSCMDSDFTSTILVKMSWNTITFKFGDTWNNYPTIVRIYLPTHKNNNEIWMHTQVTPKYNSRHCCRSNGTIHQSRGLATAKLYPIDIWVVLIFSVRDVCGCGLRWSPKITEPRLFVYSVRPTRKK